MPDGRAKALVRDCEASLASPGRAADRSLPAFTRRIRARRGQPPCGRSAGSSTRGSCNHVGLSNVNRRQLDAALDVVPVIAVEVSLGPGDDRALRGGVVERCAELGIAVIAHSPLGGPRRAGGLVRNRALDDVARALGVTPAEVALAWLLDLSPVVVAIPGARRPDTARSAARAATLALDADARAHAPPEPRRHARRARSAARAARAAETWSS